MPHSSVISAKSFGSRRATWLDRLRQARIIAIIRAQSISQGLAMAKAAAAGGIRLIEVTWTNNPQPAQMTEQVAQALPHCLIGAGSVLSIETLQQAIAARAQFCFCPHTDPAIIQVAKDADLPIVPGAMTPTEILTAWQAGADSVKVFPISALGNERYVRSLLGPLGNIPLVPTGGVTSESAPALIQAGALAVGLSTALFPTGEVARADWAAIEARSRYLLALLSDPQTQSNL